MTEEQINDIKMSDKEKADCLIELHREQLGKFKQTRNIEFKINFSLWSFILVSGYYLKKELQLYDCKDYLLYVFLSALLIFVHWLYWMRPIQSSEDTDNHYINQYRHKVEELTNITIEPLNTKPQNWVRFEVLITLFLLIIVAFYLGL